MPLLITYSCENHTANYGYSIEHSIANFINEVQEYDDGAYIIVNVIEITDEQAREWDGAIKGM